MGERRGLGARRSALGKLLGARRSALGKLLGARRPALGGLLGIIIGIAGCSDSTAPPAPLAAVPDFVYVADSAGWSNLVLWKSGVRTTLTASSHNTDPNSQGARIVWTSDRVGRLHIFIGHLGATLDSTHQVTTGNSFNRSAVLSPSGDSIAFVSTRSGTSKVWLVNTPSLTQATFDAPVALATGAANYTPEDGPAWNPKGGTIAFTSVRTGTSQVYVIPSGGGTAIAVTNESGGAFQPTWSADGTRIYYIAAVPNIVLRRINADGTQPKTIAGDSLSIGGPASCNADACLFGEDPSGSSGNMLAAPMSGAPVQQIFPRTAAGERQPAVVRP